MQPNQDPQTSFTVEQRELIEQVKSRMRVSKVVCTRAIKSKHGDFFVGWSSAWDTIQDDAGGMGADLITAMPSDDAQTAMEQHGMTVKQAKIATCILGMQVELQALMHALAGGGISETEYRNAATAVRRNYTNLLQEAVSSKGSSSGKAP